MHRLDSLIAKLFVSSIRACRLYTDGRIESNHGIVLCEAHDEERARIYSLIEAGAKWPHSDRWKGHESVTHQAVLADIVELLQDTLFATSVAAIRIKSVHPMHVQQMSAMMLLAAKEEGGAVELAKFQSLRLWPPQHGWKSHDAIALPLSIKHVETIVGELN